MAILEDSFLADLDELSDNELDLDGIVGKVNEDIEMEDLETLTNNDDDDDLDTVSKLQKTERYSDIMRKVEESLESSDDPKYELIMDCNQLLVDIENEIVIVHNYIRHKYKLRFPELESLVLQANDYARAVKQIGNETDLTLVDLKDVVSKSSLIAVLGTASTTKGKPLPEDVLRKTIEACDRVLDLDSVRKKVLDFVESKMGAIAPNLSAIVGSDVAAKLVGSVGGLSALAKMPSSDIQVLGQKRKNLVGFSSKTSQSRVGYLEETKIYQTTPPGLRMKAIKILAGKSTLAARIDATRGDPSGTNGKALKEEICKKIEKWQEPAPARQVKPLRVPDSQPKKKRGGRRLRKTKEKYAMTEMRKLSNRVAFGVVAEESTLGDGLGEGYGMLGHAKSNKLRVSSVPMKMKINAKVAKKLEERQYVSGASTSSGFRSSLAFTPVQGIELCNPQAQGLSSGTQSTYFSESFSKVKKI